MTKNISTIGMKKKIAYGFLIALMMTSCSVYEAHTIDIPLINKKKDSRIDVGISSIISANATFSYGLTEKIAVQSFGSIGESYRYFFQGAVGYFKDLGTRKVMESYCGVGYGYGNAFNDANPGNLFGNYQLYFSQFNFGKIDSKFANSDFGFGIKVGLLHSNMLDKNYYNRYSSSGPYETLIDNSFILEPAAFWRFGGERLKFNLKLASCFLYKFTNGTATFIRTVS
jgi:hypothetical protein